MASLVWNWLIGNAIPIGYGCIFLVGAITGWILCCLYPKE